MHFGWHLCATETLFRHQLSSYLICLIFYVTTHATNLGLKVDSEVKLHKQIRFETMIQTFITTEKYYCNSL